MWQKTFLAPEGRSDLGRAVMLGLNFAVGMAIFSFVGYWIDQKRGGGLLFTISGMVMGLGYGAYEVWKVIQLLNEEARKTCLARRRSPAKDESDDTSAR